MYRRNRQSKYGSLNFIVDVSTNECVYATHMQLERSSKNNNGGWTRMYLRSSLHTQSMDECCCGWFSQLPCLARARKTATFVSCNLNNYDTLTIVSKFCYPMVTVPVKFLIEFVDFFYIKFYHPKPRENKKLRITFENLSIDCWVVHSWSLCLITRHGPWRTAGSSSCPFLFEFEVYTSNYSHG